MGFDLKRYDLHLLEPQIELLLKALQYYINNTICMKNGVWHKVRSEKDCSEYTLLRDTYEIINAEYITSKTQNNNKKDKKIINLKKFA